MKIMKRLFSILFCGVIFISSYAEDQKFSEVDAALYYNQSIQLMKTDLPSAIKTLDSCLMVCNILGDSALETRLKAEQFKCDLYVRYLSNVYYNEKNPAKAIIVGKQAIETCEKYQNADMASKSKKIMSQAYSSLASTFFSAKNYDKALVAFDSSYFYNPESYKMLLNKAIIYKIQTNTDSFERNINKYIELAAKVNDTAQVAKGKAMALEYFRSEGSKANAKNKLNDALELLNKALFYGNDKDTYYFLSDVYNKLNKFDEAIENAQKGLALEKGTAEDKAKYYYSLGVAYLGVGKKDEACTAFKNAMYGQFIQAAKAQRINNKCAQ
jgi:tetratricopeptide (TPR) repeat protein